MNKTLKYLEGKRHWGQSIVGTWDSSLWSFTMDSLLKFLTKRVLSFSIIVLRQIQVTWINLFLCIINVIQMTVVMAWGWLEQCNAWSSIKPIDERSFLITSMHSIVYKRVYYFLSPWSWQSNCKWFKLFVPHDITLLLPDYCIDLVINIFSSGILSKIERN